MSILALTSNVMIPAASAQSREELDRVRGAESLIYGGRCADAVKVMQDLQRTYPGNVQINNTLMNALVCNKQYDSALMIADHLIAITKEPSLALNYHFGKLGIHLRKGDTKSAESELKTCLALVPENPQSYEQASTIYMNAGYYPDAVKLLLDGRKKFGDPLMFAKPLGQLYEVMRNYGDAAREYFQLVVNDTSTEVYVTGKFASLIKLDSDEGFDTGLKEALAEIVKANPRHALAQRYFGDFLIAQGKLDDAFLRFRLVDSLETTEGKQLLYFARICLESGDYKMVEKACNFLLAKYPKSMLRFPALYALAQSYYSDDRFADALSVYNQIVTQSPNPREIADALYSVGYTKLYGLHDPKGALETFDQLLGKYAQMPSALQAKVLAGDCNLALGRIKDADSIYASVPMQQLQQRYQEELLFKQAELKFFQGDFSNAKEAYGKMMNTYPKSVFVNDCLRRIMLIADNDGMEEATLRLYSDASYAAFRFDYDTALVLLDNLKKRDGSPLQEIAWYDAGQIYLGLGRGKEALNQFDSLVAVFPKSFYAPLALESEGDVYAELDHDCALAKSTYESVILNYATGLNVENVRRKLQRVDRILCAQSEKPKS